MSIWVTSDWHFNHDKILQYCRPEFSTILEHNQYIIEQFNETVSKDDLVYVLGDVGFTPKVTLEQEVRKLNGRKILIIGNHDKLTDGEYRSMGFIDVVRHPVYYSTNIILSHIPVREALDNPWVINAHGHLHHGQLELPNYFNVNVEMNGFKPINIEVLKNQAGTLCKPSRYEPFRYEWYHEWEVKTLS